MLSKRGLRDALKRSTDNFPAVLLLSAKQSGIRSADAIADWQERSHPAICYVATVPVTLSTFVLPSAEYLQRVGRFSVTLISSDGESNFEPPVGIHFKPINMRRGIDLRGIGAAWQLYLFFRSNKFDIVQFSTPNASLYASIASALAGVPVRVYAQWGIRYVGFVGTKRILFKTLETLVCRLATHVEPDSRGNLDFSVEQRLYPEAKGFVVWNGSAAGVDLAHFNFDMRQSWRREIRDFYGISEEAFVLGFVGRLCRDKGGNELLTAALSLFEDDPHMRLLIVGPVEPTTLEPYLLTWAQQDARVILAGTTNLVPQHMAALDTFVLPSYREGFGSVVIEAEAMGVPVVVTDIPGPLEAIQPNETGLVIPVRDSTALIAAILQLKRDGELRDRFGEAGVKFVRHKFDRSQFQAKLLARRMFLFDSISGRRSSSDNEGPGILDGLRHALSERKRMKLCRLGKAGTSREG